MLGRIKCLFPNDLALFYKCYPLFVRKRGFYKMKNEKTEVVFILDRSGSMCGLESDTIGGFNGMLEKQKKVEGEAFLTTVLFDDRFEVLHAHKDIKDVKPLTEDDYYTRGCTALLDAIGRTIGMIDRDCTKVVFTIITDGLENASREFSLKQIKKMIDEKTEKGWEFIFLGANIDAIETAGSMGIAANRSANYINDSKGVDTNFKFLNRAISAMRTDCECLDEAFAMVNDDYNNRKSN